MPQLDDILGRSEAFKREAHDILGLFESAPSRVIMLDESYKQLALLNIKQDDLMKQAFRCAENGLYRAAHVMAWAAFMDFYEEILASDGLVAVRALRVKWTRTRDIEELREYQPESALIDLAQPLRIASKNEMKALHSMLGKRNQCAHPSSFAPDLNATLGFMSEALHYLQLLNGKTPVLPDAGPKV